MKTIELIEYKCTACGDSTGLWTDESMHACGRCLKWELQPTGFVVDMAQLCECEKCCPSFPIAKLDKKTQKTIRKLGMKFIKGEKDES